MSLRRAASIIAISILLIAVVGLYLFLLWKERKGSSEDHGLPQTDHSDLVVNTTVLRAAEGETIRLETCNDTLLCALWLVAPADVVPHGIVPLARSYDGHPWEVPAGAFSAELEMDCNGDDGCLMKLPRKPSGKYTFQLTESSFSLTREETVARFLEQATFGPTRAAIREFTSSRFDSFAGWVKHQQTEVPVGSHRRFFRRHATHRFELPVSQGVVTGPCEAGSRYRKFAFTDKDFRRRIEIRTDLVHGRKLFLVDGQLRTFIKAKTLTFGGRKNPKVPSVEFMDGSYTLCRIPEDRHTQPWNGIGARFSLHHPGLDRCGEVYADGILTGIPEVAFDAITPPTNPAIVTLEERRVSPAGNLQNLVVEKDLGHPACADVPAVTGQPPFVVVGIYRGEYYLHDPRFLLGRNTVREPLSDGGGENVEATASAPSEANRVLCSNVPRNFVNEDSCVMSLEPRVCDLGKEDDSSGMVLELSATNFERIYNLTGGTTGDGTRYVYAVTGLRQDAAGSARYKPPCTAGATSRWIPVESGTSGDCSAGDRQSSIHTSTAKVFEQLIRASDDTNPFLRDLFFPTTSAGTSSARCHQDDAHKFAFAVLVEGTGRCWRNVHPSHLQVYDFTGWVRAHPGGASHIRQFAQQGFLLQFPAWHGMDRFYDGDAESQRIELGRLGDVLPFRDLPAELVTEAVAADFGAVAAYQAKGPSLVCGSPEEVANDNKNEAGDYWSRSALDSATVTRRTSRGLDRQKTTVWMALALNGDDQLRQRMAWALSQILVVTQSEIGLPFMTEIYLAYYDIFVRHAFGNYFDILKEVSFSPLMAQMLSYEDNRATAWTWDRFKRWEFPNENIAREIMQLFTIGLYEMHNNGTLVVDSNGLPIRTYDNTHITEYSRTWTGFQRQPKRGNIEDGTVAKFVNRLDPMSIRISHRDHMPKLGLKDRYIGDGFPLCSDLPERHFLKAGATYRFGATDPDAIRLKLETDSELRKMLCNGMADGSAKCRYEAKVILEADLPCHGHECDIGAPRVIEVEPGLFYEYIRIPCVFLSFYNGGRVIRSSRNRFSCGDPRVEIGAAICCESATRNRSSRLEQHEKFHGERVSHVEAERRCKKDGHVVCTNPWLPKRCDRIDCTGLLNFWTSIPCSLQVKIDLEGSVAIVHEGNFIPNDVIKGHIHSSVRHDTKTFFRVVWNNVTALRDFLNDYDHQCRQLGCGFAPEDGFCLCSVSVTETKRFSEPPTRDQVLSELYVGALQPNVSGNSTLVTAGLDSGLKMYSEDGSYTSHSIFEVVDDNGVTRYLKNLQSVVSVGNNTKIPLSFRNPTHLINFLDPETRDAHYETDATLEHYFYHKNTAPFLAIRLAQRFGNSNPSPRYVEEIATAFRTGNYVDKVTGISFGNWEYGDLASTIAAVLLDREARSVILDGDPTHGSLLEPFPKLLRVMRSLDFKADEDRPLVELLPNVQDLIGQAPHRIPNVFSFFRPEFGPSGSIGHASLKCPECEIFSMPRAIALNNGLASLVKYGLETAYGGFGRARRALFNIWEKRKLGEYSKYSVGHNTYKPRAGATAGQVVDELATLLTSGRLSRKKRQILEEVYEEAMSRHSPLEAIINTQQLITSTPEFHSNGLFLSTDTPRPVPVPTEPAEKPYRAVIYIMLAGGCDSFNLVAPEVCHGKNDAGVSLEEQYRQERGILAYARGKEREVQITVENQPCTVFAIHDEMKLVKELYDDGDLLFVANTGVLNEAEGMDKSNWDSKTRTTLFAHDTMQDETQKVDPFQNASGTGVLGRLSEVLTDKGFHTNSISVDVVSAAVIPTPGDTPVPMTLSRFGATAYNDRPPRENYFGAENYVSRLNTENENYSNLFGETWAKEFTIGMHEAERLKKALKHASIGVHWPQAPDSFAMRLREISKLIITAKESRGVNRDLFFAQDSGYDHHVDMKARLREKFTGLNEALSFLVRELKDQRVWKDVTVVVASEFGRTLTPNSSKGSDHAWGGNYFIMGGHIAGGKMLGKFPTDLTPAGPLTIGRGRLIPTTSWDSVWNGVSQWMGATTEDDLDRCLPNRHKAVGATDDKYAELFTESDLYES